LMLVPILHFNITPSLVPHAAPYNAPVPYLCHVTCCHWTCRRSLRRQCPSTTAHEHSCIFVHLFLSPSCMQNAPISPTPCQCTCTLTYLLTCYVLSLPGRRCLRRQCSSTTAQEHSCITCVP
jgi:hypothetical protein